MIRSLILCLRQKPIKFYYEKPPLCRGGFFLPEKTKLSFFFSDNLNENIISQMELQKIQKIKKQVVNELSGN